MTNEQINVAIAEACGWKHIAFNRGWIKAGDGETQCVIPDYCNDLNAMHEAEKTLPESLQEKYLDNLYSVCNQDSMYNDTWKMNRATAHQRAEAFLRTIGKWEGAK